MDNFAQIFTEIWQRLGDLLSYALQWVQDNPATIGQWYCGLIRWVLPLLALGILVSLLRSMLHVQNPSEIWGLLSADEGGSFPIYHWECTVGRAKHCDVQINLPFISRTQCSLTRNDRGEWLVHELSEHGTTAINGVPVAGVAPLHNGDMLSISEAKLRFRALSKAEIASLQQQRWEACQPLRPWHSLSLLTVFQLLIAIDMMIVRPDYALLIAAAYLLLAGMMWTYILICRGAGKRGFEIEIPVFFSCSMCLAVTASSAPAGILKQTIAIGIGIVVFLLLGWFLRDLKRALRCRYFMAGAAIALLALSLLFGAIVNGAQNWIQIAGVSVQPSELAKICFIFAGSAALDRLFVRKNLWRFILFSFICFGMLGLMSDFGTAAIFFVVFLVIAYLRSGDFATLTLVTAGAAAALGLILVFRPYVMSRFAAWGHVWAYSSSLGYQQTRAMSAAASGGLIGVGGGQGWLHYISAADTDLVFAMVAEEWGLIIALLMVAGIIALAFFTVRICKSGRSTFYSIAACAAASLFVFQTGLNVLGSVDILPLTGVTFPFLSRGGSSMIASWGLLAFIKAADTRRYASFAVRHHSKAVEQDVQPTQEQKA